MPPFDRSTDGPREKKAKTRDGREEGDEEDGTRIANRPERNFFRTSRDGGRGGGGLHEFIISVAVHPSVIPCSCRSRHINQNQKHCRGNRARGGTTGYGVYFYSVYSERREERREWKLGQATTQTPPPLPLFLSW